MKVYLPENLRELRKSRNLTQEQLAEAMGVTVGAVSKWESGTSTPDIAVIMDLADFFNTSVDALLGFTLQSPTLENTVRLLKELRIQKDYDRAFHQGEKALQKYPNSFSVVYECGMLWQLAGLERQDPAVLHRCRELLSRAMELIDQNRDPEVSPVSIRNAIAVSYLSQGDRAKALELLKENNVEGINDCTIGTQLSMDAATSQEALIYLIKALLVATATLIQFCIGYNNACLHLGRAAEALEFTQLLMRFLEGFCPPGKTSYLDKSQAMLLCLCAFSSWKLGNQQEAEDYLRQARNRALYFDAAPDYTVDQIKFVTFENSNAAYDDFGPTALAGIEKVLEENRELFPQLITLWEEICHEKT